jgi:putative ABC transport system permease protein
MLSNYLKIAWKVLLRNPFYTFITLFGISFTLLILLVLSAFLDHLFGSHYPEQQRYRTLYVTNLQMTDSLRHSRMSGPMSYKFLKKHLSALNSAEDYGISSTFSSTNAYMGNKRVKFMVKYADPGYWRVTDFEVLAGKVFNQSDIDQGARVAVITEKVRDEYFSQSESVVGKKLEFNGLSYSIIGMVKGSPITHPFTYADVVLPYNSPKSGYENDSRNGSYTGIIRARNASDFPKIQQEFEHLTQREQFPFMESDFKAYFLEAKAETFLAGFVYQLFQSDRTEIFFSIVSLFMLLFMSLPAINLINLNVSRIIERSSEISIRKAFGAPSKTILWQFMIENVFVTLLGAFIALVFAQIILGIFNRSGLIPYSDLSINYSIFGIGLLLALIFGLMSGVVPAWRMSKLKPAEALKNA